MIDHPLAWGAAATLGVLAIVVAFLLLLWFIHNVFTPVTRWLEKKFTWWIWIAILGFPAGVISYYIP